MKLLVFSVIPPLSGEPSLFVLFQSILRSIIESKGINHCIHAIMIFSQAEVDIVANKSRLILASAKCWRAEFNLSSIVDMLNALL